MTGNEGHQEGATKHGTRNERSRTMLSFYKSAFPTATADTGLTSQVLATEDPGHDGKFVDVDVISKGTPSTSTSYCDATILSPTQSTNSKHEEPHHNTTRTLHATDHQYMCPTEAQVEEACQSRGAMYRSGADHRWQYPDYCLRWLRRRSTICMLFSEVSQSKAKGATSQWAAGPSAGRGQADVSRISAPLATKCLQCQ